MTLTPAAKGLLEKFRRCWRKKPMPIFKRQAASFPPSWSVKRDRIRAAKENRNGADSGPRKRTATPYGIFPAPCDRLTRSGSLFDGDRAGLVFRRPGDRVIGRIRQPVCAPLPEVEGHPHQSFWNLIGHFGFDDHLRRVLI